MKPTLPSALSTVLLAAVTFAGGVAAVACSAEPDPGDEGTGSTSEDLRRHHDAGGGSTSSSTSSGSSSGSTTSSSGSTTSSSSSSGSTTSSSSSSGSTSSSSSSGSTTSSSSSSSSSGGGGTTPVATRLCNGSSSTTEQYGLPAPASVPAGTSFLSDWTARPIAGGFNGKQAVDDCRMHADGFLTWHGKAAVRVEVNPGDDPLGLGTERAELLSMQDTAGHTFDAEGTSGATLFYATSYYFPTTWDGTFLSGDENSWSFVNQLYGWGGLAAGRRSATGKQTYWFSGATNQTFSDGGAITLGKWTDFVFQVSWASGAYVFYRRDEGQTKFVQVLSGTSSSAQNAQYYKQGLYRGPDVQGRTDVLWIGPTSRGTSFAAVEGASFGTNDGT